MEEIWKDIVGYEGLYQVSNIGNVRNDKRLLNLQFDKYGYIYVKLTKNKVTKGKKVHRLVAQAFIPTQDTTLTVNHKNEVPSDNRVENLEWLSPEDNNRYSKGVNISFFYEGEFRQYGSSLQASEDLGITVDQVWRLSKESSYAIKSIMNILQKSTSLLPSLKQRSDSDSGISKKEDKFVVRVTHSGTRHYVGAYTTLEEVRSAKVSYIEKNCPFNYYTPVKTKVLEGSVLLIREFLEESKQDSPIKEAMDVVIEYISNIK